MDLGAFELLVKFSEEVATSFFSGVFLHNILKVTFRLSPVMPAEYIHQTTHRKNSLRNFWNMTKKSGFESQLFLK